MNKIEEPSRSQATEGPKTSMAYPTRNVQRWAFCSRTRGPSPPPTGRPSTFSVDTGHPLLLLLARATHLKTFKQILEKSLQSIAKHSIVVAIIKKRTRIGKQETSTPMINIAHHILIHNINIIEQCLPNPLLYAAGQTASVPDHSQGREF